MVGDFFVTKKTNSKRKMGCEQRKGMISFSLFRFIQVFRQLYNIVYLKESSCIVMKAQSKGKMFLVFMKMLPCKHHKKERHDILFNIQVHTSF
ncbi:hypothetical protein COL84_16450 [Bacillus pseudomycoides]|nr:hypothetical protein CN686_26125 [Bacillus pseudomycoides]PGA61590.1 hypothetical protein COL84_16450 [Bacillus pseudomycoides]